jgi:hypothetical protein
LSFISVFIILLLWGVHTLQLVLAALAVLFAIVARVQHWFPFRVRKSLDLLALSKGSVVARASRLGKAFKSLVFWGWRRALLLSAGFFRVLEVFNRLL